MKISFTYSAFSDLEAIKEYYLEKGVPQIGEEFVVSILSHVLTLKKNSDIGRLVPEFNSPKLRELIHAPFRVVYLTEKNSIHIVRLWRSERILELPDG